MRAEVGQVWASTRKQDVAAGHNQQRRVLGFDVRHKYQGYQKPTIEVPLAIMTCDGNGGKMRSKVSLRPDGSLSGHRLVAEADPRLRMLADTLRGIDTRVPYGWYDKYAPAEIVKRSLADEVYEALLWPRNHDGSQNPKIEVVLHQDALLAITQRLAELGAIIEQSAQASLVGLLDTKPESE